MRRLCTALLLLAAACNDVPLGPRASQLPPERHWLSVQRIDKVDLLLVVDDSPGMADKQALLARSVPVLLDRLVNPRCVDAHGLPGVPPPSPDASCPAGFEREGPPLKDIHIGVITSSLGGHGSGLCAGPAGDEQGHLVGRARTGVPSYDGLGFLAWDPAGKDTPPGSGDEVQLGQQIAAMITVAGESGCAYPAPLEAWYRFLVDPNPPDLVAFDTTTKATVVRGTDQELIAERKSFLRPDSLVAIVMLADRNDCSVMDAGLGWLVGYGLDDGKHLPAPTSVCAQNPNDRCCHSCGAADPPGCGHDPVCDAAGALDGKTDAPGLRCFDEKRRFGIDLLYPTARYANALADAIICPENPDLSCPDGGGVPNPLYSDISMTGRAIRGPDLVFLAGIVGVPWQDLATSDTLADPDRLRYMTASELDDGGRWHVILGDPASYIPPTDPFMHESIDPRTGANPVTGDPIAPPSAPPTASPENGHEYSVPYRDDLQYACIFPLASPVPCDEAALDTPLCEDPVTGEPTSRRFYAKAYPGLRELDVLRRHGANSVVASVCPASGAGGYAPAIDAIGDRVALGLDNPCLPRPLDVDSAGKVSCTMIEAVPPSLAAPSGCSAAGRFPVKRVPDGDSLQRDALVELKASGACDVAGRAPCSDFSICAIQQTAGACQDDMQTDPGISGFCYVADNPQGQHIGDPLLLATCPAPERQRLRFVGGGIQAPLPEPGATYLFSCWTWGYVLP